MKDFNNKVVVITGAASGMGRAYALAFAKQGSLLALCDVDQQGLEETIDMVGAHTNKKISHKLFDISDEQATFEFADQVKNELGDAHVIINNAGIEGSSEPVWASSGDSFRRVMAVNYFGVVNGTRAFLPQLQAENRGVIVNVSSIFGLVGTPNHADYCASKFAVRGFTEALMVELYSSNIQVHSLHPGGIDTNIAQQEHSREISKEFLITPADDVAEHVIRSIRKNERRIVFGHKSFITWLAVRLLPLSLVCKLLWSEMKSVIELRNYNH